MYRNTVSFFVSSRRISIQNPTFQVFVRTVCVCVYRRCSCISVYELLALVRVIYLDHYCLQQVYILCVRPSLRKTTRNKFICSPTIVQPLSFFRANRPRFFFPLHPGSTPIFLPATALCLPEFIIVPTHENLVASTAIECVEAKWREGVRGTRA